MELPTTTALALTSEIRDMVNNALTSNTPMLLAAVSPDGKPVLSFRGSTQAFSDTQLSIWARNHGGDTLAAIQNNPHVALMYRSAVTPLLQFHGRARIATAEDERAHAYEILPELERKFDPERTGIAVIIDLDRVEGVLRVTDGKPVFCRMAR
jgi:hypothetical protein